VRLIFLPSKVTDYKKLLNWFTNSVQLLLEDGDTDTLVKYYNGRIINMLRLETREKSLSGDYKFTFGVNSIEAR
jgi:hypothetical protein